MLEREKTSLQTRNRLLYDQLNEKNARVDHLLHEIAHYNANYTKRLASQQLNYQRRIESLKQNHVRVQRKNEKRQEEILKRSQIKTKIIARLRSERNRARKNDHHEHDDKENLLRQVNCLKQTIKKLNKEQKLQAEEFQKNLLIRETIHNHNMHATEIKVAELQRSIQSMSSLHKDEVQAMEDQMKRSRESHLAEMDSVKQNHRFQIAALKNQNNVLTKNLSKLKEKVHELLCQLAGYDDEEDISDYGSDV